MCNHTELVRNGIIIYKQKKKTPSVPTGFKHLSLL